VDHDLQLAASALLHCVGELLAIDAVEIVYGVTHRHIPLGLGADGAGHQDGCQPSDRETANSSLGRTNHFLPPVQHRLKSLEIATGHGNVNVKNIIRFEPDRQL
jgi:hypothetical protein